MTEEVTVRHKIKKHKSEGSLKLVFRRNKSSNMEEDHLNGNEILRRNNSQTDFLKKIDDYSPKIKKRSSLVLKNDGLSCSASEVALNNKKLKKVKIKKKSSNGNLIDIPTVLLDSSDALDDKKQMKIPTVKPPPAVIIKSFKYNKEQYKDEAPSLKAIDDNNDFHPKRHEKKGVLRRRVVKYVDANVVPAPQLFLDFDHEVVHNKRRKRRKHERGREEGSVKDDSVQWRRDYRNERSSSSSGRKSRSVNGSEINKSTNKLVTLSNMLISEKSSDKERPSNIEIPDAKNLDFHLKLSDTGHKLTPEPDASQFKSFKTRPVNLEAIESIDDIKADNKSCFKKYRKHRKDRGSVTFIKSSEDHLKEEGRNSENKVEEGNADVKEFAGQGLEHPNEEDLKETLHEQNILLSSRSPIKTEFDIMVGKLGGDLEEELDFQPVDIQDSCADLKAQLTPLETHIYETDTIQNVFDTQYVPAKVKNLAYENMVKKGINPMRPVENWLAFQVPVIPAPDDSQLEFNASNQYSLKRLVRAVRSVN